MTFGTFAALYNILMRFNRYKNEDNVLTPEGFTELIQSNVLFFKDNIWSWIFNIYLFMWDSIFEKKIKELIDEDYISI